MSLKQRSLIGFLVAAIIYVTFAVYLYQPYFKGFNALRLRDLFVVNIILASLGCYVLSRRWVAGFGESFFAGAIYGFGPFILGLAKYHPTIGLLTAAIPWLFCPAAFGPKGRWQWIRIPLAVLPFLAIALFFQASTHYRLFPVSTQARLHLADLYGLLAPLVMAGRNTNLIGFYHIPIAALIIGFSMLLAARRFGIMLIFAVGTILSFCDSFFGISPIIWFAISMLCCSVLMGAGMQGLACAGFADRGWILAAAAIMCTLAIVTLLLATKYFQTFLGLGAGYAKLFTEAGKMYVLGAIVAAIIFFMIRAKLRMRQLRQVVLCAAMALDIFLGARFIIDKIL
jgi:arginine exporter protein ArgO